MSLLYGVMIVILAMTGDHVCYEPTLWCHDCNFGYDWRSCVLWAYFMVL
jgi:hypothetical protein